LALAAILSLLASQSTFAAHPVYTHHSGSINPNSGVDLDFGYFNEGDQHPGTDDVHYDVPSSTEHFLGSTNNAQIAKWLLVGVEPTYKQCSESHVTIRTFSKLHKLIRHWFCVRTNEGRWSKFKVLKSTTSQHVDIVLITWCKPPDNC
jgi:hypothetical protein